MGSELWCNVIKPWIISRVQRTHLVIIFCGTAATPWVADSYFKSMVDNHTIHCCAVGVNIIASYLPLLDGLPSDLRAATKILSKRVAEYITDHRLAILNETIDKELTSVDKQPRGKKAPLLIQPYRIILQLSSKSIRRYLCKDTLRVKVSELLSDPALHIGRLLVPLSVINRDVDNSNESSHELDINVPVGVFWKPWEYVEQTKYVQSPYLANVAVDMEVAELVLKILELGPSRFKKDALTELARWRRLKASLSGEEEEVHNKMHPDVKAVMEGKCLVLLEKLATEAGIEDRELMDNLRLGFPLTGCIGPTGRWKRDIRLASMSEDEHATAATWIRAEVSGRCMHKLDEETQRAVQDITNEEVEQGYLLGPYSPQLALQRAGPGLTYARRFVLKQKDKWRPIDDFSVSRTNACLSTLEKAKVDSLDEFLALTRFMIEAARNAIHNQEVTLPDMTKRQVRLHEEWRTEGKLQVLGRCLDLANAYKQFAVSPACLSHSAIAVPNMDTGQPDIYFTRVLPFGATASVYHFLRLAEVLKLILRRKLGLLMCCYFDDYPCATYSSLATLNQFVAEKALDLLGVKFSMKPHKRLAFAECFSILGVQVRFPRDYLESNAIEVKNTLERQQEIKNVITDILEKNTLTPAEASSLSGRLGFLLLTGMVKGGNLADSNH